MTKNEIFEQLLKLDPNVFTYTRENRRKARQDLLEKLFLQYNKENGNLAIPYNYVIKYKDEKGEEKEYRLGPRLHDIRRLKKGKWNSEYDKSLIAFLESLDPRVFEDNYFKNINREKKELLLRKLFERYFNENGNLAIPSDNVIKYKAENGEEKQYKLGKESSSIKQFKKGHGSSIYNDSLIKFLESLDPRVFEERYHENIEREKDELKLRKLFQQYFDENGNLAIPLRFVIKYKDENGEKKEFKLGRELVEIKQFKNGQRRHVYNESLINFLEYLDPRVFEYNYNEKINREKKELLLRKLFERYFNENRNLAISSDNVIKYKAENGEEKDYRLGKELDRIKIFKKGKGHIIYSDSLIKFLESLDPRVFEENYAKHLKREQTLKKKEQVEFAKDVKLDLGSAQVIMQSQEVVEKNTKSNPKLPNDDGRDT